MSRASPSSGSGWDRPPQSPAPPLPAPSPGARRGPGTRPRLQQYVEGIAIEWLRVGPASPVAGTTIAGSVIRSRSGVSVVAVLRGDVTHPAPGPGFRLEAGDP